MAHTVNLENTFSGPMDLLLYLVRRDEIDIHDIPVSHLTREYLAEIERMELVDVDAGGEFVAMASMLTEIKSRMLLPAVEAEGEGEEEESFDPRQGLVRALLEYKRFKEVASELEEMSQMHLNRFGRIAPPPPFAARLEIEAQELGALDLFAAFQKLARKVLSGAAPREIINEEISTEVRIAQIEELLQVRDRVEFSSLLSDHPTKEEMVGFFIALLELVRLKKVRAQQSIDFSEIYFFHYSSEIAEELPRSEEGQPDDVQKMVQGARLPVCSVQPLFQPAPLFSPVSAVKGSRKMRSACPEAGVTSGARLSFLRMGRRTLQCMKLRVCGQGFPFMRAVLPAISRNVQPAEIFSRTGQDMQRTVSVPQVSTHEVVPSTKTNDELRQIREGLAPVALVPAVRAIRSALHIAPLFSPLYPLKIKSVARTADSKQAISRVGAGGAGLLFLCRADRQKRLKMPEVSGQGFPFARAALRGAMSRYLCSNAPKLIDPLQPEEVSRQMINAVAGTGELAGLVNEQTQRPEQMTHSQNAEKVSRAGQHVALANKTMLAFLPLRKATKIVIYIPVCRFLPVCTTSQKQRSLSEHNKSTKIRRFPI